MSRSHRATPKGLRAPALPPASEVTVTDRAGNLLRVEPPLERLPARTEPSKLVQRKPPKPPEGPNRFTRTRVTVQGKSETRKKKSSQGGRAPKKRSRAGIAARPVDPAVAYRLNTDGACSPNPGPASIGVVLTEATGREVARLSRRIGSATNNIAEYRALIEGLRLAREHEVDQLAVRLDSRLVVQQVAGDWYPKTAHLRPLRKEARALVREFDAIELRHVPRDQNAEADELANAALGIRTGANSVIRSMKAEWEGPCRWCGYPIALGDRIFLILDGKVWVCESCSQTMCT